jgi:hypothetical protein
MSADIEHMEHRWGSRVQLNVATEIRNDDEIAVSAVVKNASISGAYLETEAILPLLSCVSMRVFPWGAEWLDACVVRVDDSGLALEWLDPGSRLVSVLLAMRRDSRGEVLQTVPDRVSSVLASSRT